MTLIDDKAYFAGRLEPLDLHDTGAHGIITGEIDSVSGKLLNTRFEVMSNVSYVSLEINVSKTTKNDELVETIRNEIVNSQIVKFDYGSDKKEKDNPSSEDDQSDVRCADGHVGPQRQQ